MYWSISQFPELDHLEPEQRAQLLARISPRIYLGIAFRALLLAFSYAILAAVVWGAIANDRNVGWVFLIVAAIGAPFTFSLQLNVIRTQLRAEVAKAFAGQRAPFCFHCGYDLREETDRCPECGQSTLVPEQQKQEISQPCGKL